MAAQIFALPYKLVVRIDIELLCRNKTIIALHEPYFQGTAVTDGWGTSTGTTSASLMPWTHILVPISVETDPALRIRPWPSGSVGGWTVGGIWRAASRADNSVYRKWPYSTHQHPTRAFSHQVRPNSAPARRGTSHHQIMTRRRPVGCALRAGEAAHVRGETWDCSVGAFSRFIVKLTYRM